MMIQPNLFSNSLALML